ncbi:MAG: HD domain-containing protein [Nitrososphaerales archaeon]
MGSALPAEQPLPDIATAESWLAEQGVEGQLLAHVRLVAAIAEHLAGRLANAGESVDPVLAQRGGLLHDLAKLSAKKVARSHELMAAEILLGKGQPELAEIARRHAMWAPLTEGQRPETREQKLVYYADRIAEHDRLVGIDARMLEIAGRRPELRARIEQYRAAALAQEAEIAAALGVSVPELWREIERGTTSPTGASEG